MREAALAHLVHPDTLEPLRLHATGRAGDDVLEGTLTTGHNGTYAIRNGVPGFVPPETAGTQTVRSFDQKWSKHQYYREHTARFYTEWYLQRYGFGDRDGLREHLENAQFILDAGTGSGRDAVLLAEHSPAVVFGVDTSASALNAARSQVDHPRVAFVQADLNRMPFPDGFFDLVNCDQVIHHTPDPRASFEALRRKLKPGGQICCYVYRKKAVIREFTDDYIRERVRHLPVDEALEVCEGITRLGKKLAGLNLTLDLDEDIPILGIRKGSIDLQRFFHWNLFKCFWNDEFDFFTNNVVNFDWYHPEHCHRFEPEAFRAWFAEGWDIRAWDEQEAGLSCRAVKV